jgi:hypothetical protein
MIAWSDNRGRPNHLHYPSPSCEWLERGSKVVKRGSNDKSPGYGLYLVPCSHIVEGDKEGPDPFIFPTPTPADGPRRGKT